MLRTTRAPLAAFLLLCLLGSLGPLRSELAPAAAPSAVPLWLLSSWPYLLIATLAFAYTALRHRPWLPATLLTSAVFVGLGLFVVPNVAVQFARSWIDPFTEVILLALTPVFTVVLEPHIAVSSAQPRYALLAATTAASGLLLVFPFSLPRSASEAAGWLLLLVAAGVVAAAYCSAVHLISQRLRQSGAPLAAIASAASALAFLFINFLSRTFHLRFATQQTSLIGSTLIEASSLLLFFWLLPRLSALRLTTRFVLSPLFSSLVSLILLRPTVTARDVAGLLLAAGGSAWLLLAPVTKCDPPASLLGLDNNSVL